MSARGLTGGARGASRSDTAMGAIAAAAEETGDAAAHLGEAQHGRKGRKQGPHRRGERRAKAMGAATLAAAGAWRGGVQIVGKGRKAAGCS